MLKKLSEMKEMLISAMEAELGKGIGCVNTEEAGEVIDMIKDLCEAEEKCMKAMYYCAILEGMDEEEDDERIESVVEQMMRKSGYDNWRYSSGRFAPKGRGHRSGYVPMMPPYYDDKGDFIGRMGYVDKAASTRTPSSMYGESYDRWKDRRRHYTETHSMDDKSSMDHEFQEHTKHMMESIQEMWTESDPDVRRKMKMDLQNFVSGLQ